VHPAPDEHRLAGGSLIGSFNKRHRHYSLIRASADLYSRSASLVPYPPPPVRGRDADRWRAPTLHLEPRWRPPETVGLFAREWVF
jgi:hypothetical protein